MIIENNIRLITVLNALIIIIVLFLWSVYKDRKSLSYLCVFGGLAAFRIIPFEIFRVNWYTAVPFFLFFLVLFEQKYSTEKIKNTKVNYLAFLFFVPFFLIVYTIAVFEFGFSEQSIFSGYDEYQKFISTSIPLIAWSISGLNLFYKQYIALSLFLITFSVFWWFFLPAYCMMTIIGYLVYHILNDYKELSKDFTDLKRHFRTNIFSLDLIVSMRHSLKKALNIMKVDAVNEKNREAEKLIAATVKQAEDYLCFVNDKELVFEECSIKHIIDNAIYVMKRTDILRNDIHCSVAYFGDFPDLRIDVFQINQILYSMLLNAAEAMDHKGIINVNVRAANNNGNAYVEIAIQDRGHGIPREHLLKIFEPQYTTKRKHLKGLGLSGCRKIIEQHDGLIKVDSEVGSGSTFSIFLKTEKTFDINSSSN